MIDHRGYTIKESSPFVKIFLPLTPLAMQAFRIITNHFYNISLDIFVILIYVAIKGGKRHGESRKRGDGGHDSEGCSPECPVRTQDRGSDTREDHAGIGGGDSRRSLIGQEREGDEVRDPNDGCDPSACGAPWNEGDDGECECTRCAKARRDMAKAEAQIDEMREGS